MSELQKSGALILHELPPADIVESWRRCLAGVRLVTHYVTPEFFAEPPTAGNQSVAFLCCQGNEVVAIATGTFDKSALQCGMSNRPQIAISSQANEVQALADLSDALQRFAKKHALKRADLVAWDRLEPLTRHGFFERRRTGAVILDLKRGPDALFKEFSENKRTNIKKAIKKGVVVEATTDPADLAEYYKIYRAWSQAKNLPFGSQAWFTAHLAQASNRKLFVARHEGRIVAGVIVRFAPGFIVEYSANASLDEALHLRPNDLLHWRVIEWACKDGFQTYSLAGSHMFLRKFGGTIHPTFQYVLDRTLLRRFYLAEIVRRLKRESRKLVSSTVARARGTFPSRKTRAGNSQPSRIRATKD